MRVAVLSSGMPTKTYPLNGVFAFDQAKALAVVGIYVYFLSVDMRSIRKFRKWGFTCGVKDGIRWYNVSIPVGPIWFLHRLISKSIVNYLFKKAQKKEGKPDILHAHFAGAYAYLLGQKYNIPYVITEHSSAINSDRLQRTVIDSIKPQYQIAARVLAVSTVFAKRIKQNFGIECLVIPDIIDTRLFSSVVRIAHKEFRLVTTSNLINLKRTANILKVMPDLLALDKNIKLEIIGEGPLKKDLISISKSHGLEENVVFHGLLSRDRIAEIYKVCDCFVLPSSTETFGVAYVEAMASGLPVIATRCGGPEDFVDDTNGILIDVDDLQQLKEALVYMYQHYKEYDSKAIKSQVAALFSPEVVAKKIISVYEEIITN